MKLVILTKSAKRMNDGITYGNCVAGINERGDWVRLVSDADGDSLSDRICKPFDCLDVIDVEASPCPIKNQPENAILEQFNKKIGRYTINDVVEMYGVDCGRFCFVNSYASLSERERRLVENSLILIKVQKLSIYFDDRHIIKAQFTYNKTPYSNISITDNRHKKPTEFSEAYIVMSLPSDTGKYSGYYKFIAAVYPVL